MFNLLFSLLFSFHLSLANTPQNVASQVYRDFQYSGFAVGNHQSLRGLELLEKVLIENGKLDPSLKYILIEAPSDLAPALIQASKNEFPWNKFPEKLSPFWSKALFGQPQWAFIFGRLLKTLQEINTERLNNPILMVPIDSYTTQKNERDIKVFKEFGYLPFGGSISREKQTAQIFLDLIAANPASKALIFYHHAHLLKNVRAFGQRVDQKWELTRTEFDSLGWIDFAESISPGTHDKFGIILVDEQDAQYNPFGFFDWLQYEERPTGLSFYRDFPTELDFADQNYFQRYRGGSIQMDMDLHEHFDALIVY